MIIDIIISLFFFFFFLLLFFFCVFFVFDMRDKKKGEASWMSLDYSEDEKVVKRFLNNYELLSRRTDVRGFSATKSHNITFLERRKKENNVLFFIRRPLPKPLLPAAQKKKRKGKRPPY